MKNNTENLDFSTVLASSVHDMKNSLAMLLGSIADITSDCNRKECSIRNSLSKIKHEGLRVNHELVQLLTLYKIGESQYHLDINEILVHDFLEEVVLEYKSLLVEYGINIELECDPSLIGFFDAELIGGVLKTIINNAYQYANNKILVRGEHNNGFLKLSIIDNGDGYPANMLIEPSTRQTPCNFGTGSTGLGLYFSSQVASMHKNKNLHGHIQITNADHSASALNGGCFSIFLP